MSRLYLVPTPVGNMEDITLRAIRILKEVDLILAEDTRTTGILLSKLDIKKPMQSHHKFNEHKTAERYAERIAGGESIALVSDAGTPGISDPGFMLVRACIAAGVEVECLPGPTAFVPAIVASGLPVDRFVFEGFLPEKKGRKSRLEQLAEDDRTTIIYESPMRVVKTLEALIEVCGRDRSVVAAREISKLHEEFVRGTLAEVKVHFENNPPRGEFILLLGGKRQPNKQKIHTNKYKTDAQDDID